MTIAERLDRLRDSLRADGVEDLLVTGRSNVRYLCGFTGSAGLLVVRPRDAYLVTDGRYADQAPGELADAGVVAEVTIAGNDQRERVTEILRGVGRVGVEAQHLTMADAEDWRAALGAELTPTVGLVERLREVKDSEEIDRIRRAAAIVDTALASVLSMLAEEPTELGFAAELDAAIRRHGATGNSFETIVAAGSNGSLPHARPSQRTIRSGELIVVDVGARLGGYCSDMTRTFCAGAADDEAAHHYRVVAEAQAAGVAALGPGVVVADVDAACRSVIAAAGWAKYFNHGTGHGVGLDIHEAPRVAATGTATLLPGHVVTVEPGVYLPSRAGVRVEDLLVITETGAEALTLTPKTLTPDAIAAG